MVNTILKEADLFCPNSIRINFTIYLFNSSIRRLGFIKSPYELIVNSSRYLFGISFFTHANCQK
ncbi:hypothetical protein B8W93_11825 [Lentilactobacillus kefiri]|nr:hypothetical protein B8W85_12105 [Lentilactobacillus kefiri]PAL05064.1 hypothetical protein B8W93_11825 [Lentilactobacillus kefiri]